MLNIPAAAVAAGLHIALFALMSALAFALELCGAYVLEALSSLSNPAIQECEALHLQQFELPLGMKIGTYQ